MQHLESCVVPFLPRLVEAGLGRWLFKGGQAHIQQPLSDGLWRLTGWAVDQLIEPCGQLSLLLRLEFKQVALLQSLADEGALCCARVVLQQCLGQQQRGQLTPSWQV